MERVTYIVSPQDEGKTLGQIARRRMGVSAALLRRLKTLDDGIMLDDERVFVNVFPKAGQVISLASGAEEASENIVPQDGFVDIAYEDELMLIVRKAGGMPAHPSRGHYTDTLANLVVGMFNRRGEDFVFRAINRLDSGTSGLMCIAKSQYAANVLGEALTHDRIRRTYYAVCCGEVTPEHGTIDLPIGRMEGYGIKRHVTPDGQSAVTHYRVLEQRGGYSLLEINLETGRTHQIRVHFSYLGFPLYGDFMYGDEIEGFMGCALHSCKIEIELSDRNVRVSDDVPQAFIDILDGRMEI